MNGVGARKKIISKIVATNIVESKPPDRRSLMPIDVYCGVYLPNNKVQNSSTKNCKFTTSQHDAWFCLRKLHDKADHLKVSHLKHFYQKCSGGWFNPSLPMFWNRIEELRLLTLQMWDNKPYLSWRMHKLNEIYAAWAVKEILIETKLNKNI